MKVKIVKTNEITIKKTRNEFLIRVAEMEGESKIFFKTFLLKLLRKKKVLINATGRIIRGFKLKHCTSNVRKY